MLVISCAFSHSYLGLDPYYLFSIGGPEWTRTTVVSYVTGLQPAGIATTHTDPYKTRDSFSYFTNPICYSPDAQICHISYSMCVVSVVMFSRWHAQKDLNPHDGSRNPMVYPFSLYALIILLRLQAIQLKYADDKNHPSFHNKVKEHFLVTYF